MARNKGTFAFAANFEVKIQGLLDPRGGVTTKSELINKETFPYDGDTIYMKEGMLVTVQEEQSVYMLVSLANILAEDYSGWKRIDGGATAEEVEASLAAMQEQIDALSTKLSAVYRSKGSVNAYDELPGQNQEVGDVYNVVDPVEDENGNELYPAGTNFVWNGTEWDALGGMVDLSGYATKDTLNELREEVTANQQATDGKITVLETAVETNKAQLESATQSIGDINLLLNGNDNDEDDIPNQKGLIAQVAEIEEKNTAQDTRLTNLEKLVSGGEAGEGNTTLLEMVNANTAAIASLQSSMESVGEILTEQDQRIGANETAIANNTSAIDVLNGDSETVGSVDYKIAQTHGWIEVE